MVCGKGKGWRGDRQGLSVISHSQVQKEQLRQVGQTMRCIEFFRRVAIGPSLTNTEI